MGYWWAIRAIPRLYFLHRQNVNWPVGKNTMILGGDKILFHVNSINVFQQPGCYFQAFATINIGNNVWIGQNTGIITANHNLLDPEQHEIGKPVYIGDNTVIENCIVESRDTIRANTTYIGTPDNIKIVIEKNERYTL